MRILVLLAFAGLLALAAAYITRPHEGRHRGVAVVLMDKGLVERPGAGTGRYAYEDFYVVTFSAMSDGDRQLLQCWGVFTRFLCIGPAGSTAARSGP